MITIKALERSPHLAELKVSYRRRKPLDRRQVTLPWVILSPCTAEKYLRSVWNLDTLELVEEFVIVCLNNGREVLGWVKVASGGLSSAPVDPRLVFGVALQAASSSLILAHNHPGGQLQPSAEDRIVTKRLKDAGSILGIEVADHIILTKDGAYSFMEHGIL